MTMASIVLITGCSKGIGQCAALHLANDPKRRFKVYATMRNTKDGSVDIRSKAGSVLEDTLFILELDVTKQDTIDRAVKHIVDTDGRIDVLVNNAGVLLMTWWETADIDTYKDVMEVNYFGCVRMTKAVVPFMKAQRSGRILQISSVAGLRAVPCAWQYNASKFALEGFSEAIAPPLRKFNVWVSIIQAGLVSTPMTEVIGKNLNEILEQATSTYPEEDRKIILRMLTGHPTVQVGTQSVDDIAKLFEEIITSPKPDFRYQTSETVKRLARERLLDPTGNDMMDTWMNV